MLLPEKIEPSLPKASYTEAPCKDCKRETRHKVLAQVDTHYTERGLVDWWETYQILQCQGCMTESFCHEHRFSEDRVFDADSGEEELVVVRKHYPAPMNGRPKMENAHYLPQNVAAVYSEAISTHAARLPISTGFGIRAIVEAVCTDKGIAGSNLEKKIDGLSQANLITPDSANILHGLRFMGNAAAHDMKAHSNSELNTAFDIADILLQNVYVLPQLAKSLPK